jgi:hypothetical protein
MRQQCTCRHLPALNYCTQSCSIQREDAPVSRTHIQAHKYPILTRMHKHPHSDPIMSNSKAAVSSARAL